MPAPRSLRKESGRGPGGQGGRQGKALVRVARPGRGERHEPRSCAGCGQALAGRPATGVERRQVPGLPPLKVEVTGHQLTGRQCACGRRAKGAAPEAAGAPVRYGPQAAAIIVYLYAGQFLPAKRAGQALAGLFGTPLPGTAAALTARAAGKLDGFPERAREEIAGSAVAGFGGTGFRADGKLAWVHCARTGTYTLLMVHDKRGRKAIGAMGIVPSFAGTAVHDAWSPYDCYVNAGHQPCRAHVLRESQAVAGLAPAGQWCWATQAAGALVAMRRLVTAAIEAGLDVAGPAAPAGQVTRYHCAALIGLSQTAARSGKLMTKHHALARRLLDRQDDYLRFTTGRRVPPDNNGSERDIRMIKMRQKVSGRMRTLTGARQFCAIRSYLSTAAKHGNCFFDALVMLTSGPPWTPTAA